MTCFRETGRFGPYLEEYMKIRECGHVTMYMDRIFSNKCQI